MFIKKYLTILKMEIKFLQEKYKEVVGKKPYHGWEAPSLIEKMLAAGLKPEVLASWEGEAPEEVAEVEEVKEETSINDWQLLFKGLCDKLYRPVMDARYRRVILDAKADDNLARITSKAAVINELEKIKGVFTEGHLKALVSEMINKISNE
jgi:hypothetical protein